MKFIPFKVKAGNNDATLINANSNIVNLYCINI